MSFLGFLHYGSTGAGAANVPRLHALGGSVGLKAHATPEAVRAATGYARLQPGAPAAVLHATGRSVIKWER